MANAITELTVRVLPDTEGARAMANAITELTVRVLPDTTFRSSVTDPMPTYPDYAGKLSVVLDSGALRLDFTYGYAWPADIHAAIARLRDTLDKLDIDVDAAIARQTLAAIDADSPAQAHEVISDWTRPEAVAS